MSVPRGQPARVEPENPALRLEFSHWLDGLRRESPRYEATVAELRRRLLRVARHELSRRRHQLGSVSGPELEDVAEQSADDAVLKVIAKLDDFRGASRFTTWAYKFAIFEVSAKLAEHAWGRQPADHEPPWETIADSLAPSPERSAEQREVLAVLRRAIEADLTPHQRRVFVAVALNEVPIDVLAVELASNRNAVYKNLFDARRKLRAALASAGHGLGEGG